MILYKSGNLDKYIITIQLSGKKVMFDKIIKLFYFAISLLETLVN